MGEIRIAPFKAVQSVEKQQRLNCLLKKSSKNTLYLKKNKYGKRTDFMVILEIEISGRTLRIGITIYGDPNSKLQEHIQTFLSEKCELIYCACRTSCMTVDWVNSFAISHTVRFVQKLIGTNYDVLNQKQADELLYYVKNSPAV